MATFGKFYKEALVPDTRCWIGDWEDRPDWANPVYANEQSSRFCLRLQPIIAEEMSVPEADDNIPPGKIDILEVSALAHSDSKKVIVHVHTYPTPGRTENMPDRLKAIARRIKQMLGLPEDEECVAVCFKRVEAGDWAKA